MNIKLIAKSGNTSGKKIVLVTTDPSIIRLAGATKIPVTKDLQSAPSIPEVAVETPNTISKEELVEESNGTVESEKEDSEVDEDDNKNGRMNDSKNAKSNDDDEEEDEDDDNEDEGDEVEEKTNKKPQRANQAHTKKKISSNKFFDWIHNHKKLSVASCIGALLLVLFLVWAFAIAPAATVTVGIRTTSNNFSENVTFTNSQADEKASEGVFYLDEKKIESIQEVEFEATGEKNIGQKARGEVKIYAYFPLNVKASVQISEGEVFAISGLNYKALKSETLSYSGEGKSECGNKDNSEGLVDYGCRINGVVSVEASEPGSKYNIAASSTGWDTNARVFAYSDTAMEGGTDDKITIVQQSDVLKAKESLAVSNEQENKEKLLKELGNDALVIESSFNQNTTDAVSIPNIGEEVKSGEKAKLKAVTTASVYIIDKTKVEEFIREKANIADSQKIYEMKDPFIDNFSKSDSGYIGKLKTSYLTGPELSVTKVVDLIKGKGLGDAQHALKDITGVYEVRIEPSYPWVMSVPSDTNKITVNLDIKDQSGNKVEQQDENADNEAASESDKATDQEKKE